MSITTKESSMVAAVIGACLLIFGLLNGIPWAAKPELAETKAKVERLEVKISDHEKLLAAFGAQAQHVREQLTRIEAKLDKISSGRTNFAE